MSDLLDLLDHRDAFFSLVADAHGTAPHTPVAESVLPSGSCWTPHTPKPGPLPARRRRPASEFCDLLTE